MVDFAVGDTVKLVKPRKVLCVDFTNLVGQEAKVLRVEAQSWHPVPDLLVKFGEYGTFWIPANCFEKKE